MSKDEDFSIISVNSDDDEEIVILAGIIEPSIEEPAADAAPNSSSEASEPFRESFVEEPNPNTPKKEEYQGITEEDLYEKGPFNKMRLIIIACGVLLLVGFIVYFLFMR